MCVQAKLDGDLLSIYIDLKSKKWKIKILLKWFDINLYIDWKPKLNFKTFKLYGSPAHVFTN